MSTYAIEWLMHNAGPIIKYRTSRDLLDEYDSVLEKKLLECELVKTWLSKVQPNFSPTDLHSSKPYAFENSMGRLYELGLRKGHKPLDDRTRPFLKKLEKQALSKGGNPTQSWFLYSLMASYLAMTGYSQHIEVDYIINRRLEIVHEFTVDWDLKDFYVDSKNVGNIPPNFRNRPIINPKLWGSMERFEKGSYLPSIHDIHGFLHSQPIRSRKETIRKVEEIMEFILSAEYQSLEPGYGVIYEPKTHRFYSAGWSVHLKGYFDVHPRAEKMNKSICFDRANLLRLSQLSRSKTAREHRWFKEQVKKLEAYRRDELYLLPRNMLEDRKTGYWVAGRSLGLEENRRTRKAIIAESTFRMLEIKK